MDTPRLRSPRPPQLSKAASPPFPPPQPPQPASPSSSHDFSVPSPSPIGGHLLPPLISMSRTPVGRVGSDLSHLSHARTSHHHATTSNSSASSKDRDKDRAKNKASPAFFSGLGGAWRKDRGCGGDVTGNKQAAAEEKRKDNKAKRALEVGQWVKRHMAAMVEQLRASFSSRQEERDRREQRRRPHSFSGHGPSAARERERWRQRRGQLSSAPASLRVSPANSGHLSVGGSVKVSTSSEESTMEELQSAIEAAIVHCKNSICVAKQQTAAGDKTKLQ